MKHETRPLHQQGTGQFVFSNFRKQSHDYHHARKISIPISVVVGKDFHDQLASRSAHLLDRERPSRGRECDLRGAAMKVRITATIRIGEGSAITVTGREAQTIIALVNAGPKGITSLDTFKAGWAVRLGAYVFDLRGFGVPIETTREPHDGGNHARYRLAGPVTLLHVEGHESQSTEREAA